MERAINSWRDNEDTTGVSSEEHALATILELREAGTRLARVNENARALLQRPLSEGVTVQGVQVGDEDGNAGRKRRRLDKNVKEEEYPEINYGRQGQVSPGPLKMEIASCDGGIMDWEGYPSYQRGHKFAPENVLRDDDNSVYCTKKSTCNLVLKHQGESLFNLERLVITAPRRLQYTDP